MFGSAVFFCDSSDGSEDGDYTSERRSKQKIRNESDPLKLTNKRFIKLFRLSKEAFLYVLSEIEPEFNKTSSKSTISSTLKLATTLRFLAEGSYQQSVGQDCLIGMSQPTVSRVLKETLEIIEKKMCTKWINFNMTSEEKNHNKQFFFNKHSIPGIIGHVDGTHIKIIKPNQNEHLYFNRKGYHSINAMIICDYKMQIRCVDGCYGGASHDSFIWRLSQPRKLLEENWKNGDKQTWLLGDSGYPLEPWIITPFRSTQEGTIEAKFNETHSKARNIVERTIGVLKARFRCLIGERGLHNSAEKDIQMCNVCCALHNICIHFNISFPEIYVEDNDDDDDDNVIENETLSNVGKETRYLIALSLQ